MHNLLIMSAGVVTSYGSFVYEPVSVDQARRLVDQYSGQITSAIGHDSTAQMISELLGVEIPAHRLQITQDVGQSALVFRPTERVSEGVILSLSSLRSISVSFSLLTKIA